MSSYVIDKPTIKQNIFSYQKYIKTAFQKLPNDRNDFEPYSGHADHFAKNRVKIGLVDFQFRGHKHAGLAF